MVEGDAIRIIPAQAGFIYVPSYDADLAFGGGVWAGGPWLSFGVGYPEGPWLGYDLDWVDFGVWLGPWHPGWDYLHPAWRRGGDRGRPDGGRVWRPAPGRGQSRPFDAMGLHTQVARTSRPAAGPEQRGYAAQGRPVAAPVGRAPSPSLFDGYQRGSEARAASQRGRVSRAQAVHPPVPRAPEPRRGDDRDGDPNHRKQH